MATRQDWLTEGDSQADTTDGQNVEGGPGMTVSQPLQQGSQVIDRIEQTGTIQEGEIGTLKVLADAGNVVNATVIAHSLGVHRQRAQHHLDSLKEKEYVDYFVEGYGGESSGYRLTPKGREYLVKSGTI